jgi:hypothetical protein
MSRSPNETQYWRYRWVALAFWLVQAVWYLRTGKLSWINLSVTIFAAGVWIWTAFTMVKPGEDEGTRRRRHRNLTIALLLGAMVLLFLAATMIRLGPQVANRPY